MAAGDELTEGFADLSKLLLGQETLETTCSRVETLAQQLISNADLVEILLVDNGGFTPAPTRTDGRPVVAASRFARTPWDEAIRRNEPIRVANVCDDGAWPEFSAAVRAAGMVSFAVFPLVAGDAPIGVLAAYSSGEGGFDDSEEVALLCMAQAAATIANAQTYAKCVTLTEQLRDALESRGVIERAKGMIMARWDCSEDAAFDVLRKESQHTNRKLRDVAVDVVRRRDTFREAPSAE